MGTSPLPLGTAHQFVKQVDLCSSESSSAPSVITAAGGLDNTKVTGQTINRKDGTAMAHSLRIGTGYVAALDTDETVKLAHEIQESANGSAWDAAEVIEAATTKATGTASNERGCDEHSLDLMGRKQYFRINVTLDLSRGGTDTASFHSVGCLTGWDQNPIA